MRRKGGEGDRVEQYRAYSAAKFVSKYQYGADMSLDNMKWLDGKAVGDFVSVGLEAFLYLVIRNTIKAEKDWTTAELITDKNQRPFTSTDKKMHMMEGGMMMR